MCRWTVLEHAGKGYEQKLNYDKINKLKKNLTDECPKTKSITLVKFPKKNRKTYGYNISSE